MKQGNGSGNRKVHILSIHNIEEATCLHKYFKNDELANLYWETVFDPLILKNMKEFIKGVGF